MFNKKEYIVKYIRQKLTDYGWLDKQDICTIVVATSAIEAWKSIVDDYGRYYKNLELIDIKQI